MPGEKRYLTSKEVADIYGIKQQTLANWRHQGIGPPPSKSMKRGVRYCVDDLEAYFRAGKKRTKDAPGPQLVR